MTLYIYGLCYKDTDDVFYIGVSRDPYKRHYEHVTEVNFKSYLPDEKLSKKELAIRKTGVPNVIVLDSIETTHYSSWEAADLEDYWMWQFKSWGYELTNRITKSKRRYKLQPKTKI